MSARPAAAQPVKLHPDLIARADALVARVDAFAPHLIGHARASRAAVIRAAVARGLGALEDAVERAEEAWCSQDLIAPPAQRDKAYARLRQQAAQEIEAVRPGDGVAYGEIGSLRHGVVLQAPGDQDPWLVVRNEADEHEQIELGSVMRVWRRGT